MLVWRRLAPVKWADAWEERLRFLGPERLVFEEPAGMKSVRIDAYALTQEEGALLVREFGGKLRTLHDKDWTPSLAQLPAPISIRGKLVIVGDPAQAEKVRAGSRIPLVIPGGIAFGTGHHATTSTCLRMLSDIASQRAPQSWDFLDIGTGSGILALAASKLGAEAVKGLDFDAAAVRTCRENARINAEPRTRFEKQDILQWSPAGRTWHVVAANLFSQVLIASASTITRCIRPGGTLLLSGILRTQEEETLAAFTRKSLHAFRVVRKGKWVTARLEFA